MFVKFSQSLYNYSTVAIEEFLAAPQAAPARPQDADEAERLFERLRKMLKGQKGIHPIKLYSDVVSLKGLGISQETFSDWYHCWLGQQKFRGKGTTERKALDIVLAHFPLERASECSSLSP